MGQDELDLVEALAATPVLNYRSPPIASVTKTMDKDDGGRVLGSGREKKRGSPAKSESHFMQGSDARVLYEVDAWFVFRTELGFGDRS